MESEIRKEIIDFLKWLHKNEIEWVGSHDYDCWELTSGYFNSSEKLYDEYLKAKNQ